MELLQIIIQRGIFNKSPPLLFYLIHDNTKKQPSVIEDEVSEMSLTFGVTANDDDTLTLDMGDLGSATVQEATLAVAVQGLKYAVENGTEMN